MKTKTEKLVFTALCAAIGVVLPLILHAVPRAGMVLLPMHIPVLLAGLAAGPVAGLATGLMTPLLSSLLTGMPPLGYLAAMMPELAAYGLFSGLFIRLIHTKSRLANLYLTLLAAMLSGRVVYGLVNALLLSGGKYAFSAWVGSMFVTALPGIAIQLILLPGMMMILDKTGWVSSSPRG